MKKTENQQAKKKLIKDLVSKKMNNLNQINGGIKACVALPECFIQTPICGVQVCTIDTPPKCGLC